VVNKTGGISQVKYIRKILIILIRTNNPNRIMNPFHETGNLIQTD